MSIGCCQLTRTDVGLMKVTVMFSGAAGIEPERKKGSCVNKLNKINFPSRSLKASSSHSTFRKLSPTEILRLRRKKSLQTVGFLFFFTLKVAQPKRSRLQRLNESSFRDKEGLCLKHRKEFSAKLNLFMNFHYERFIDFLLMMWQQLKWKENELTKRNDEKSLLSARQHDASLSQWS